jgi:hypothetical protein
MQDNDAFDRRQFTLAAVMAMLGGVTITISDSGCGSSKTPSTPSSPAPGPVSDATGTVSANHGHVAVITAVRLTAGNAVSLDIQGTASHTHTVELSAGEIVQIRGGTRVAKDSTTNGGHSHTVTFN